MKKEELLPILEAMGMCDPWLEYLRNAADIRTLDDILRKAIEVQDAVLPELDDAEYETSMFREGVRFAVTELVFLLRPHMNSSYEAKLGEPFTDEEASEIQDLVAYATPHFPSLLRYLREED